MGSQWGEWIADVERPQLFAAEGAARGSVSVVSGDVFVKLPGRTNASDGTSNTFMHAEKFHFLEGEHVLTSVHHAPPAGAAGGEDSRGLWQINIQPSEGGVSKGGWISDVTYEGSAGGNAVAMETLTIAHEGILLS